MTDDERDGRTPMHAGHCRYCGERLNALRKCPDCEETYDTTDPAMDSIGEEDDGAATRGGGET